MNLIAPLLAVERIRIGLEASTKQRVFEEAGQLFAAHPTLDANCVADCLAAREKMGSTALGQGVALPHARINGLHQPLAAFIHLRQAISFDAPDGKPVSDVLVLLVPQRATEAHLQMLAQAAEMFFERPFRDQLRSQNDAVGVLRAFSEWPRLPDSSQ